MAFCAQVLRRANRSFSVHCFGHQRPPVRCAAARSEQAHKAEHEHISGTQNAYVKHCAKLRTNTKYRTESGTTLLCGQTLIGEYVEMVGCSKVIRVLATDPADVPAALRQHRTTSVDVRVLKKISGVDEAAALAVAIEVALPRTDLAAIGHADAAPSRVLVLDGVQDPGNLGTLVRTAAALGWDMVCLTGPCCDPFSDKVVRAARGATLRVPIAKASWQDVEAFCKRHSLPLLAAAPSANPVSHKDAAADEGALSRLAAARVALVLGSEGQGLRPDVLHACRRVSIPMMAAMESLNVGVAGALYMALFSPALADTVRDLDRCVAEALE